VLIVCGILEESSGFSGKVVMRGVDICLEFSHDIASVPINLSALRTLPKGSCNVRLDGTIDFLLGDDIHDKLGGHDVISMI
jgi:hypothetical protein